MSVADQLPPVTTEPAAREHLAYRHDWLFAELDDPANEHTCLELHGIWHRHHLTGGHQPHMHAPAPGGSVELSDRATPDPPGHTDPTGEGAR